MSTPAVATEERISWLTVVRDAVRGTRHDYTQGPIARAVILLAIPMVLEMAMESVFAVMDVFFVSRLGPDATATVGLTESMMTLVYTVAIGLCIGVAAVVARRIGEKNPDGAAETAVQGIALGLVVAAIVAAIGIIFAPKLLAIMGATPSVMAMGSTYTRVMLGGSASVMLLFLINAIFRGAGDAAIAMRVLWFANAINILLGPCLIFGLGPFPRMGVAGAATATTIGRSCGVLYQLYRLSRGDATLTVKKRHLALHPSIMASLVRLSASGTFQFLVGTASYVGLVRIIATFGSTAVAGYTIAIRLVVFWIMPSWGLSNAAATLVGQSLGARDPARAERAVWIAAKYDMLVMGVVGLVFIVFASPIVGIFTHSPEAAAIGAQALRTMSYGFVFFALGMVITSSFNGAGDTWTPTWINLFVFWIFEIPLAYVLAKVLNMGPMGVFLAIMIGYSTLALVSTLVFRRGKWKERKV